MLLAIDIGNTNIVMGVYENNNLHAKWRIATDANKTEDEYSVVLKNFLASLQVDKAIFSSVVPNLDNTFKKLINKYYHVEPLIVTHKVQLGYHIQYPYPDEIGADRLVNAAAVAKLYPLPSLIVDFGTATTFCYLDQNKNYHGGLILPGIPLMLKALHLGTAKLPLVEILEKDNLIGQNTIESIQTGIFHQTIGSINYIMDLFFHQYGKNIHIILTGGLAKLFIKKIKNNPIYDADLTLKGLEIIYHLNQ